MKYFGNLIKRKKFGYLLFCIGFTILGILMFYINIKDTFNSGINPNTDLSSKVVYNDIITTILSSSNLGLAIIGLICACTGIFYFPRINPDAATDSDYTVIDNGNNIYIKYKNYEFDIPKNRFHDDKSFYRDRNNKRVPYTTRFEIYRYVYRNYKKEIENYKEANEIPVNDIINDFYGMRLATKEEIDNYIKEKGTKPFKASNKPLGVILLIIGFLLFSVSTGFNDEEIVLFIIIFAISIILFIMGIKKLITPKAKDNLYEKVINGKVYVADAYVYDKGNNIQSGRRYRLVKIWDKHNHHLDKWFEISVGVYYWDEIKGLLYVIRYNNEEILDFIPKESKEK